MFFSHPEQAIEEFLQRYETGATPDLEDFVRACPGFAEQPEFLAELIENDVLQRRQFKLPEHSAAYATYFEQLPELLRRKVRRTIEKYYFRVGEEVGGYRILDRIAIGGEGEIYKVEHSSGKYTRVLKIPREKSAGDIRGLQRELAYLVRYEGNSGIAQGSHFTEHPEIGGFVVLPYYDGRSLSDQLESLDGKMPPRQAVDSLLPVIEGIAALHREGFVHRDLKPGNLLVDHNGRWFVADFGLVHNPQEVAWRSERGVGTPGYSAPEQSDPKSAEPLGPQADVWAFGIILYRLLTGRTALAEADQYNLIQKSWRILPFHEEDGVDEGLQQIVFKCLEFQPSQRFSSAVELAEALRGLQGRAITSSQQVAREYANSEFIGRSFVENACDGFIGQHDRGVLEIVGEAGSGKTALALHLSRRYSSHHETFVFCYRRLLAITSPRTFLQEIATEIRKRYGLSITSTTTIDELLPDLLAAAAKKNTDKKLLIIVDGLDESAGDAWSVLPRVPKGVYLILTSRPEQGRYPYGAIQREVLDLRFDYLDEQNRDCEKYVSRKLQGSAFGKHIHKQVVDLAAGNMQLVVEICKALRVTAVEEVDDLISRIAEQPTPESRLFAIYESDINQLDERLATIKARDCGARLLQLAAFAHGPVPESTIYALGGPNAEEWSELIRAGILDRISRNDQQQLFCRGDAFQLFLRRRFHEVGPALQRRLADYCLRWRELAAEQRKYAVQNLPAHLCATKNYVALYDTLTDIEFLEEKCALRDSGVHDLIEDYHLATADMSAFKDNRSLVQKLKSAFGISPKQVLSKAGPLQLRVIGKALTREAGFIRDCLTQYDYHHAVFQSLWNCCWWYDAPETAQHYASKYIPRTPSGPKLYELMERWRAEKEARTPGFSWLRSLRPAYPPLRSAFCLQLTTGGLAPYVTYSPDGTMIAAAAGAETKLFDARSGKVRSKYDGGAGSFGASAFSADSKWIACRGPENTLRVYDVETGVEFASVKLGESTTSGEVWRIAFSPKGTHVAIGPFRGSPAIWDIHTGELRTLDNHGAFVSVAFSPDGQHIATGTHVGIRIFDLSSGTLAETLSGHVGNVYDLHYLSDGRCLVSCGHDNQIIIWDVFTGKPQNKTTLNHSVMSISVRSANGAVIAGGSGLTVWHPDNNSTLPSLSAAVSVAASPLGRYLALADQLDGAQIWDLDEMYSGGPCTDILSGPICCTGYFSPDRKMVIAYGVGGFAKWDAKTGAFIEMCDENECVTHLGGLKGYDFGETDLPLKLKLSVIFTSHDHHSTIEEEYCYPSVLMHHAVHAGIWSRSDGQLKAIIDGSMHRYDPCGNRLIAFKNGQIAFFEVMGNVDRYEGMYLQAIKHLSQKEYSRAGDMFAKLEYEVETSRWIRAWSHYYRVWCRLEAAMPDLTATEVEEAIDAIDVVISNAPTTVWRKGWKAFDSDETPRLKLAMLLFEKNLGDLAFRILMKTRLPRDSRLRAQITVKAVMARAGLDGVYDLYERWLERDEDSETRFDVGVWRGGQGKHADAVSHFTIVIESSDATVKWRYKSLLQRAKVYLFMGKYDDAKRDVDEAIEIAMKTECVELGDDEITGESVYVEPWMVRAKLNEKCGRNDEALADYEACYLKAANNEECRWQYAWCLFDAGQYDKVTELTSSWLDEGPSASWSYLRARSYVATQRYECALMDFDRCLNDESPSHNLRYWSLVYRGESHRLSGNSQRAIDDASSAIGISPDEKSTLAWRVRAQAYLDQGNSVCALEDFEVVLTKEPGNGDIRFQFGWTLYESGRFDELIDFTTRWLEDGASSDWSYLRARARVSTEQYAEAIHDLDDMLANPNLNDQARYDALCFRGDCHRLGRSYEQAIVDASRAAELFPHQTSAFAWRVRARAYEDVSNWSAALTDYQIALSKEPGNGDIRYRFGWTLYESGRFDELIENTTRWLEGESDTRWLYLQGAAFFELKNWNDALESLNSCLRLEPGHEYALRMRGRVQRRLGLFDDAIADLAKSLMDSGKDFITLYELGLAMDAVGRHREAIDAWVQCQHIDPNDPDPWNRAAWVMATCNQGEVRNGIQAIDSAKRACNLTSWSNPNMIATLAAAYAEIGDFENAVLHQQQAMDASLAEEHHEYRIRLKSFQEKRPIRA